MSLPALGPNKRLRTNVVRVEPPWIVSVSPMLFTARIHLSTVEDWHADYGGWTAGFCYPDPIAAHLAATLWHPATQPRPVGYLKVAFDTRGPHAIVNELPCPGCEQPMLSLTWEPEGAVPFQWHPYLECTGCGTRVDREDL